MAQPFTKNGEGVHTQRGDDSANGRGEHKRWLPVDTILRLSIWINLLYRILKTRLASMADTSMPSEDCIVILHGLKGRADLNGTKAVVLKAETPEEEVCVCVYKYMYDSVVYRVVLLLLPHPTQRSV